MKKFTWFCITALFLYLNVFCPKCLGEHTWIGKVHGKFYGEEYEEERSLYFSEQKFEKEWKKIQPEFYITGIQDSLSVIGTRLHCGEQYEVESDILTIFYSDIITIDTNGTGKEWVAVSTSEQYYEISESKFEKKAFETETGVSADKIIQTAFSTRQEYRSALRQISDWEYQRIRKKGICTLLFFAVTWVVIFFCSKRKKKSAEELDEQEYTGSMNYQLTMIVSVFMIVLSFLVLGIGLLVLMLF